MEDNKNLSNDEIEFRKALEEKSDNTALSRGKIVKGKVVQFDDTDVFIDFESKSEGKIKRREFDKEPAIGEEIEAIVSGEDDKGYVILSKSEIDKRKSQELIDNAVKNNTPIKGIVKEVIKGGFKVSIIGYQAFCPFSQIDLAKGIKEADYLGKEYDFRIIKKNGRDVVVSRRVLLEETQNAGIETFLNELKENDIINGKVKNIEKFGAFVEITPGLDGFLAIPNMSWDKVINPKSIISKGDERMFKVLSVDREKRRVDLGLKQLDEDPWGKFVEQYKKDDIIQGEVTNVKKFGAFVKVADGIEGLIHVSDLSWNSHVNNPNDFVKKGAFLECKILNMDAAERKLTLGLKQVKENPWDTIERDFHVKSSVKCKVKRIIKNFAVFELPNGLEGICDISDFDWRNNIVNMKDYVKEGEDVNMVIMSIDRDKQRIKLSYKHTYESPWRLFEKAHPQGSIVDGTVKTVIDSGVIVSLENDLEGYMHISQVEIPKGSTLEETVKVGETYPFVVREVNQSKRRISLSRREYMEAQNKKETQNYISKAEPTSLTYNPFDNINN
ncbi:S1 RNA-binding domain-containing protein [uncultured Brachyspira sp.]|uniref:S1 RNA-binding domain-containing protein n=1 Tax=uncultured Brachyspira sp. TaxID=221953 RepID=UPI0025D49E2F|nr:S1 RNA-binding domain-containing protein [uncultured Brachyspira sp.]